MTKRVKRVRFADPLTTVHIVPRGGRELEPGYAARSQRHGVLRHVHGIPVSRKHLDAAFGDGGILTSGSWGGYNDVMARRNTWHFRKFGTPWYVATPKPGGYAFKSRYSGFEEASATADMAADYARTKNKAIYHLARS